MSTGKQADCGRSPALTQGSTSVPCSQDASGQSDEHRDKALLFPQKKVDMSLTICSLSHRALEVCRAHPARQGSLEDG
jgi:hypothetical protein